MDSKDLGRTNENFWRVNYSSPHPIMDTRMYTVTSGCGINFR